MALDSGYWETDDDYMDDRHFVEAVVQFNMDVIEILNWYRNLYYKESDNTERGIVARAINDLFVRYKEAFEH